VPFVLANAQWIKADARDHLAGIRQDIDSLNEFEARISDKVQFLLDATLGFISIEQQDTFKVLTIASVVGGILGYAIGYFLFDALAAPVLKAYGYADGLARFQGWYEKWGVLVILVKGLTPIPYKLVTIASGAAQFSFPIFVAASVVTRGARFFLLAVLLRRFGPSIRDFIERRLTLVTTGAAAGIVVGFVALRYL
jgi:membrane protein YqaA with SNARE-associated domain